MISPRLAVLPKIPPCDTAADVAVTTRDCHYGLFKAAGQNRLRLRYSQRPLSRKGQWRARGLSVGYTDASRRVDGAPAPDRNYRGYGRETIAGILSRAE